MADTQVQPPPTNEENRSSGLHTEEERPEKPPQQKRSFFGSSLRVLVALIVIAGIVLGGIYYWAYRSSFETTDDAQIDAHIFPVSARVGGRITAVLVDDNQQVAAGQVLVHLDPTDYQVSLQRAQADVEQASADANAAQNQVPITTVVTTSQTSTAGASLDEARAGVAVAQQQYEAALARVREAEANADKARRDVERYRPLAQKQEISQQQFDQAVAAERALAATVETARANAEAAARQVTQSRARVSQAQAQEASTHSAPQQIAAQRAKAASMQAAIGVKQAALEQARLNITYTNVTAPVAGVIGQRSAQPGQEIQPGQQLMSVIPINQLWVTANFKETQLRNMRVGQKATVKVDATGREYRGHVDSFPGATGAKYSLLPPENATGNYVKVVQRLPVKIVLEQGEDSDHLLRPGMSCEPKVQIK